MKFKIEVEVFWSEDINTVYAYWVRADRIHEAKSKIQSRFNAEKGSTVKVMSITATECRE
jgi:hypothetical protein